MTALTALVPQAQPALRRVAAAATAGATWRWPITVNDSAGSPIDLSTCTATCLIVDASGSTIVTPTVTLGNGSVLIEVDEATTAALATGRKPVSCRWSLTITDGTDTVQFWGIDGSPFVIHPS